MKKNKIITSLILTTGIVLAAEKISYAADNDLNRERSANVEITEGSGGDANPIDPYPPTGPIVPVVGSLGISSATDLYFDAIPLSSSKVTRDALYLRKDNATGEVSPISNITGENGNLPEVPSDANTYVPGYSVIDTRGTGAGWTLTLTLGDFIQQNVASDATAQTLKGATLSFPQVDAITNKDAVGVENKDPKVSAQILTAGDTSSKVLMAASNQGEGMGMWEARYHSRELTLSDDTVVAKAPIQLTVPGNNYAGVYKADLTWNLTDTPRATNAQ